MSKDYLLYEKMDMMDKSLPITCRKHKLSKIGDRYFNCHWHENIELLYFIKGEAVIKCNSLELSAKKGDLIVVNSNDLHQGCCVSDEDVEYYCIIFDTSMFQSRHVDACETKYIGPLSQNRILFKNKIEKDKEVARCIHSFVKEYEAKQIGYEMALKATIYQLLVLLLRNHVQLVLSSKEYNIRMKNLDRFNNILEFIENNYSEKITIDQLCAMVNMSRFHFCRVFKSITEEPLGEYLNLLRINKAEALLKDGAVNVTEAAMSCGFDDMNYFSRMFKRYKKVAPSSIIKGR